jgi:hypothetical protein
VLWIRIGFIVDPGPDPAFYLNAEPGPDTRNQTTADPDPSQTLMSQKVEFLHEENA